MKGLLLITILGVSLGAVQGEDKPSCAEDWRVGTREASHTTDDDSDVGRSAEREEEFTPVIDPDS